MASSAAPAASPAPPEPTPTALAATPSVSRSSPAPPLPAAPIELASRYQVQAVLWANRKRFIVRDTATDTTIAIRTTSQIADSDLLRLNMAAVTDKGSPLVTRQMHTDTTSVRRERQCGRCRLFFPAARDLDASALQDWWLCEPCHNKLFGTHRATSSTG